MNIPTAILGMTASILHGPPTFPNATIVRNAKELQDFIEKPNHAPLFRPWHLKKKGSKALPKQLYF